MTQHILPERTGTYRIGRLFSAGLTAAIASLLSISSIADVPCPPELGASDGNSLVSSARACPAVQGSASDTPDYNDPLASCQRLDTRRTVNVSTSTALQQAVSNAACGDTIQLAPGTYGAAISIGKSCSATAPIVIKGAPNFESMMSSDLKITGARTIVTGIKFVGPNVGVRIGGTNNRLLANKFTDWRHVAVLVDTGKQAEIAYNEFSNPNPWQASEAGTYPLRIGIRTTEKDALTFHFDAWVHHNYFHDLPAKPNPDDYHSGQSDALEVCQTGRDSTATMRSGWYVESNLIERHKQGHGVVDFKCGGNVVRFNTLVDSPNGRIDARGGSYNTFESNWIENSGGTTIHGGHNKIIGNHVRGGQITIMAGDLDWDSAGGGYPRAFDTLVAGNDSSSLIVGKEYQDGFPYPALDTVVEGHVGPSPVLDREEHTTMRASTSVRFSEAFKLQQGDVGPAALRGAPSAYLSCRAH